MNEPTFEKPLPVNRDAERAILGCCLLDNSVIEQAALLSADDFFSTANRKVFAALLALKASGLAADPLTLQEELRRSGALGSVGGPAYIASIYDGVPRFSNIENYVRLVRDAARERRLIHFGQSVVDRAFDGEETLDEQLRQAESELALIGSDSGADSHWRDIAGVACDVMTDAEQRGQLDRSVLDFSTGFRDLDYVTDGFERGTVVVIGAAPGAGKTGLALSMTSHMSESLDNRINGRPPVIGWFSMEMPVKQQAQRLLASEARVDLKRLRTGRLGKDEWRRVAAAADRIAGWRVHFDDRAALSPRKMREAVRRLKADECRVDILIVDYVQLGDAERGKGETREQEVATLSRAMMQIAKDYNCVVVEISQLNRKLEERKDKRPNLGDFRDSGQIAQDGYLVIGLYRDEVYHEDTVKQNVAELILLKNRNGPLCTVEVVFLKQLMRFEDKWNR